jgi:hypothetical protein
MAKFHVLAEKKMLESFTIEATFEDDLEPLIMAKIKKGRLFAGWRTVAIDCRITPLKEDQVETLARSRIVSALRHKAGQLN